MEEIKSVFRSLTVPTSLAKLSRQFQEQNPRKKLSDVRLKKCILQLQSGELKWPDVDIGPNLEKLSLAQGHFVHRWTKEQDDRLRVLLQSGKKQVDIASVMTREFEITFTKGMITAHRFVLKIQPYRHWPKAQETALLELFRKGLTLKEITKQMNERFSLQLSTKSVKAKKERFKRNALTKGIVEWTDSQDKRLVRLREEELEFRKIAKILNTESPSSNFGPGEVSKRYRSNLGPGEVAIKSCNLRKLRAKNGSNTRPPSEDDSEDDSDEESEDEFEQESGEGDGEKSGDESGEESGEESGQ
jgi:hypothetical protein